MTYASETASEQPTVEPEKKYFVVVKLQDSPIRGKVWRVCGYVNGVKLYRPGFQKRKPAIKLAAMMVQQALVHGWNVTWRVENDQGGTENFNLAALGSKMQRGERKNKGAQS